MPKKVLWRKGMRLTDEIMTLSDNCTIEYINKVMLLSTVNHMGLFPNVRPFTLSVDINKDIIDVVAIDCLGLTRNGSLIDIEYDTNYTNSFDTRIPIVKLDTEIKYLLCVVVQNDWRDTNNGLCEPVYGFQIIEENSLVPDNALPVARVLFDEYSWRTDDVEFVPPCLYVSSHNKFQEQAVKFSQILNTLNEDLPQKFRTERNDALKILWPTVQQLMITMDKELDWMSPMSLLSNIQKFVGAFVCACTLDDYINIGEPQQFYSYIKRAYNFKEAYRCIQEGLDLSLSIKDKIEYFQSQTAAVQPSAVLAPFIEKGQLRQIVKYGSVKIDIINNTPDATIFYTTDGSTPTQSSKIGNTIVLESGFTDDWHKEPSKNITIKALACKEGICSNIVTYEVQIKKGNPFAGKKI